MKFRYIFLTIVLLICMIPVVALATEVNDVPKITATPNKLEEMPIDLANDNTITTGILPRQGGLLLVGTDLMVTQPNDGTSFFAANNLILNADIDGAEFAFGAAVSIAGNSDFAFVFGETVNLNNSVNKDAFVFGNTIVLAQNTLINRDAYFFGSSVAISGIIGRNVNIEADSVTIANATIYDTVTIDANNITFGDNVNFVGTLKYNDNAVVSGLEGITVANVETFVGSDLVNPVPAEKSVLDMVWNFIWTVVSLLLVAFVINLLFPGVYKAIDEKITMSFGKGAKLFGMGFLLLIAVPIVSILLMVTVIGIPFALIALLIYALIIYLTTILVGYFVGSIINKKLFKNSNVYLSLFIGVLVIELLKLIPVVSMIVGILVLFIGLGMFIKITKNRNKKVNDTPVETIE